MNTAVQPPDIAPFEKKTPTAQSLQGRNKQITRIITHLRDQLRESNPQLTMPTQWMIRQLVDNATIERDGIKNFAKGQTKAATVGDWREEIIGLLKIIHQACDVGLDRPCSFVHTERLIPLFPNQELFDEWDAYRFTLALLHYLEKEFSADPC